MTTYVYRRIEAAGCFTTGFYDPSGAWQAESDHATADDAAQRVHWLNGGHLPMERAAPKLLRALKRVETWTKAGGAFPVGAVSEAIAAATRLPEPERQP